MYDSLVFWNTVSMKGGVVAKLDRDKFSLFKLLSAQIRNIELVRIRHTSVQLVWRSSL